LTLPPLDPDALPLHEFGEADADGVAGESPAIWKLRSDVTAALRTARHALVNGQSGTGKELVAQAIHRRSGRRGMLVAFNAATLTPTLADSILFGNVANYPNPGVPERPGLFGQAEGGTLFLDEIGELPIDAQARFLRALEGESTRLGDSRARKIDVLLVGATNRELGRVKHDLQMRFAFVVRTPSLAERLEDIPLLARLLVLEEARTNPGLAGPFVRPGVGGRLEVDFAPALIQTVLRAWYSGNVRDLRNLLLRAMNDKRDPPMLPPRDMTPWMHPPPLPAPSTPSVEALLGGVRGAPGPSAERILDELTRNNGRRAPTAKALGMKDRFELDRRMKKLGIVWPPVE
jgi:two-component system nitrogen regulation response regulator GlnG/two-component system response regulator HydG